MNVYLVAHTSGPYTFPASHRVFKTERGVLKEYKKLREQGIREDLSVLKAQWVEADFDEYVEAKKDEDKRMTNYNSCHKTKGRLMNER